MSRFFEKYLWSLRLYINQYFSGGPFYFRQYTDPIRHIKRKEKLLPFRDSNSRPLNDGSDALPTELNFQLKIHASILITLCLRLVNYQEELVRTHMEISEMHVILYVCMYVYLCMHALLFLYLCVPKYICVHMRVVV